MKKLLIVVVIWGLILGGEAAAYYYLFQGKANDPKVADGGDKDKDKNTGPHKKLKLALDSFSGYCIFRSDEFKKKLAAQDYDFEWVDDKADYPARMKSVQAGETPLAVFTIDALLNTTPRSGDPPATIIMVIDETRGADAMIGLDPGMKDVEGLNRKDAKIVLVEDSPSETLSRVVRSQFKLPDLPLLKSDYLIPAKGADINDVYGQFLSAAPTEHKAFVLWEPYVSLALKRKGARVLVDSSQFKGYIVDVLAAQTAWLRDHPADAQAVVRTYLEQLHGLQQTDGAMAALVLSDAHRVGENKVGPDEAATMVGKIWWKNTMENYAQMGVLPATNAATGLQTLDEMIHNITTVLDQTKQPGEPSPGVARPDKLYDNSVLGALYAERPAFMIGAETVRVDAAASRLSDADWSKLRRVGLFQADVIQFKKNGAEFSEFGDVPTKLAMVAEKMRQWPQYYLQVEGNTLGDDVPENRQLAQDRANAVKAFLVEALGADQEQRIRAVGNTPGKGSDVDFVMLQR